MRHVCESAAVVSVHGQFHLVRFLTRYSCYPNRRETILDTVQRTNGSSVNGRVCPPLAFFCNWAVSCAAALPLSHLQIKRKGKASTLKILNSSNHPWPEGHTVLSSFFFPLFERKLSMKQRRLAAARLTQQLSQPLLSQVLSAFGRACAQHGRLLTWPGAVMLGARVFLPVRRCNNDVDAKARAGVCLRSVRPPSLIWSGGGLLRAGTCCAPFLPSGRAATRRSPSTG